MGHPFLFLISRAMFDNPLLRLAFCRFLPLRNNIGCLFRRFLKQVIQIIANTFLHKLFRVIFQVCKDCRIDFKLIKSSVAGLLNSVQYLYMPLRGFILLKYPQIFPIALPTVTGAHLFLFGWIYRCKPYYISHG